MDRVGVVLLKVKRHLTTQYLIRSHSIFEQLLDIAGQVRPRRCLANNLRKSCGVLAHNGPSRVTQSFREHEAQGRRPRSCAGAILPPGFLVIRTTLVASPPARPNPRAPYADVG
jgi:hypothetical protein